MLVGELADEEAARGVPPRSSDDGLRALYPELRRTVYRQGSPERSDDESAGVLCEIPGIIKRAQLERRDVSRCREIMRRHFKLDLVDTGVENDPTVVLDPWPERENQRPHRTLGSTRRPWRRPGRVAWLGWPEHMGNVEVPLSSALQAACRHADPAPLQRAGLDADTGAIGPANGNDDHLDILGAVAATDVSDDELDPERWESSVVLLRAHWHHLWSRKEHQPGGTPLLATRGRKHRGKPRAYATKESRDDASAKVGQATHKN